MNTQDKLNAIKWINENFETLPAFAQEILGKAKVRYEKSIENAPKIDPRKAELQELVRKARAELKALNAAKIATAVQAATQLHKDGVGVKEVVEEAPKPAPKDHGKK